MVKKTCVLCGSVRSHTVCFDDVPSACVEWRHLNYVRNWTWKYGVFSGNDFSPEAFIFITLLIIHLLLVVSFLMFYFIEKENSILLWIKHVGVSCFVINISESWIFSTLTNCHTKDSHPNSHSIATRCMLVNTPHVLTAWWRNST